MPYKKPSKQVQFKALIKKASTNFELFAKIVGKIKLGAHQQEWIRVCQEISDNPFGNLGYVIVAPPGSGKSLIIAVLFSAFMIGRYPNEHFGLISYSNDPAKERAIAVRNIIENSSEYHLIFPDILPDKRSWGTKSFRIQRKSKTDFHPTFRAGGATSSIVSYRLSGVIIDDPHDPKNTTTSEMKEKVYANWSRAIKTRLLDGAFRLCITTRWADDDFAGTLLLKEGNDWEEIIVQAITPNGKSYWPEQYSVDFLKDKEAPDPETFAIQYMGDTTKGTSGYFKDLATYPGEIVRVESKLRIQTGRIDHFTTDIRYIHPKEGELDLLIGVGIDTALKDKERNDYTVMYVGGLDQYGKLWILHREKGRFMLPEMQEKIIEIYERFHPYSIWIEDAAAGTPAVSELKYKLPHYPLVLQNPTQGGKRSRALSLQPYISSGDVVFPKDTDWYEDAKYWILRYGSAKWDDDLDALFLLVSNLITTTHPAKFDIDGRLNARLIFG